MSEAQIQQTQTVRHKKPYYDLKATYQPSKTSPQESTLTINLKISTPTGYEHYRSIFTEQTIPQEVIVTFSGIDIAYECFKEEAGFQVNLKTGQIIIKGVFEIKGRKIEKKALIPIEKYKVSQMQTMFQQMQQLEQEVQILKSNKKSIQEQIRKQYQSKLEAQKKKFDEAIKLKQLQQKKGKERQKQLQLNLQSLQNQMNSLINKIDLLTRENLNQFQQLKIKSETCQLQLLKTKQQFMDLMQLKRCQEGRKMVKLSEIPPALGNGTKRLKQKQNLKVPQNSYTQTDLQKDQKKGLGLGNFKTQTKNDEPALKYVDEKSTYLSRFKIKNHNSITYVGENGSQTSLLMKEVIPRQQYHYQFKIMKTHSSSIMIGVVDRNQAQKTRFSDKRSVSYWGKTGYIWGGDKMQGEGYGQGDKVHVKVQLSKPYIEWRVNGKIAASCEPNFFLDETKIFVPFIEMENQGDCVVWNDKGNFEQQ